MSETSLESAEKIASLIWTWYGQDEWRNIILVGELAPALVFLTLDAQGQQHNIGCCAECNLWSHYLEYLHNFVQRFPAHLQPQLYPLLRELLSACEALSPAAYGTLDSNGFEDPQWAPLREMASTALELMGWPELQEHLARPDRRLPRRPAQMAGLNAPLIAAAL